MSCCSCSTSPLLNQTLACGQLSNSLAWRGQSSCVGSARKLFIEKQLSETTRYLILIIRCQRASSTGFYNMCMCENVAKRPTSPMKMKMFPHSQLRRSFPHIHDTENFYICSAHRRIRVNIADLTNNCHFYLYLSIQKVF